MVRFQWAVGNAVLVLAALGVGLLLSEVAARVFLNPADYLSAPTTNDEVLGIRIAAGASGFDEWGFRNRRVPPTAEIVAIGDSHTYGNNATMAESWPSVVERLIGRTVYNLGLGGYGPNQYYHLLMTRALKLKPRWVLCGLYMGDDFENAFLMTYGRDAWANLRQGRWSGVEADIWSPVDPGNSRHARIRTWLSRKSLVYQLVVHGPVLGGLKGTLQVRRAADGRDPATTSVLPHEGSREEAFRPLGIRARLDPKSGPVREGMRITVELLGRMDRACQEHGCRLLVVLIPTKETVFAEHLLRDPRLHLGGEIAELVSYEAIGKGKLIAFLEAARIPYVDVLPTLRSHIAEGLYTRSDRDMHPGPNGYRVIGETVAEFVRQRLTESSSHR
jgi:hypothetical protein